MGNFMCGVGGGGGFWGVLFTIILWALIIWAIIAIIQHFGRKRNGDQDQGRYYREDYEKHQRRNQNGYMRRDQQQEYGDYQHRSQQAMRHDAAMEILRQRYARGEITREEFEAGKKDLM